MKKFDTRLWIGLGAGIRDVLVVFGNGVTASASAAGIGTMVLVLARITAGAVYLCERTRQP